MTAPPPAAVTVDALGRRCPLPVIDLARAAAGAAPGTVLEVLADDAAARHDVPAWCAMRGHAYLGERPAGAGTAYVVRTAG
ncbi:sulfurtransferase TusA family protein [Vallicoccus soli]|uniref:Sulfurtransferase TusA family protein n=1 Tax=Vallicoccus soli TaxID=2339232 RepID=A0A3A3Z145_9ACTN|nr:sulfurtransferase TusA family protein [Vallicoccus soli]RJK96903.1 sulfurtransferase TusA family protein [Vallicoccus soli]